jgi:hypothetical protein
VGWEGAGVQGGSSQRDLIILKCFLLTCLFLSLFSALYMSMKDTEKGVKELNLEKDKKIFNHCFTGKRTCTSERGNWGGIMTVSSAMCVG